MSQYRKSTIYRNISAYRDSTAQTIYTQGKIALSDQTTIRTTLTDTRIAQASPTTAVPTSQTTSTN